MSLTSILPQLHCPVLKSMQGFYIFQPADNEEVANIMSSLINNKASCGPFSIQNKILILLKKDTLKQLANLFNLSFSSGSFPSIFKTAKIVPAFKKDFKLDYCLLQLFLLYQMLKKYLDIIYWM